MAHIRNHSNKPPKYGPLQFTIEGPPISLQAKSFRKDKIRSKVNNALDQVQYFLSDDVQVEVCWYIHERSRYEKDSAPDIDNIVKPIMDAISGVNGILLDDCQVQAISCYWVDSYTGNQRVELSIDYQPEAWVRKNGLRFVHVRNGLCYLLPGNLNAEQSRLIVRMLKKMVDDRDAFVNSSVSYYSSKPIMSSQRVFHRTRIASDFEVVEATDILN